jgi:hypothetical protein
LKYKKNSFHQNSFYFNQKNKMEFPKTRSRTFSTLKKHETEDEEDSSSEEGGKRKNDEEDETKGKRKKECAIPPLKLKPKEGKRKNDEEEHNPKRERMGDIPEHIQNRAKYINRYAQYVGTSVHQLLDIWEDNPTFHGKLIDLFIQSDFSQEENIRSQQKLNARSEEMRLLKEENIALKASTLKQEKQLHELKMKNLDLEMEVTVLNNMASNKTREKDCCQDLMRSLMMYIEALEFANGILSSHGLMTVAPFATS